MLGENFLLNNKTSQHLFFDYAKDMPIYDYHCHLNPREIAENKKYDNISQMWLYGDHYKWRYMRSMGIDEEYITGSASDYDKFLAYAKAIQYAIGNPLYHWSHLELQRYFDIHETLNEKNAPMVWNKVNKIISEKYNCQYAIKVSNVDFIGTTDDPFDSLEYHKKIAKISNFNTRVIPTFRPDKAIDIDKPTFCDYVKKSGAHNFKEFLKKIAERLDYFESLGSKISDHSLNYIPFSIANDNEIETIFKKALSNEVLTDNEIENYKTAILLFLGKEYAKRNFVMQLHIGPIRNTNTKMFKKLGADAGFDSINDNQIAFKLSQFMNALDIEDSLPKSILYSLNPNDNYTLATMLGNFQTGGVKGKIQLGSGWWFNDNIDGMTNQIKALANCGALSAFVGMLTDSRSFISYPRHEYFRRILCNIIGTWVENGEFDNDEETLEKLVKDICYNNAKEYFGM